MKVGVLTFPNSVSYGATLQMYALYRSVEKMGHRAEIVNYQNQYMKAQKHFRSVKVLGSVKRWSGRMLHQRLYQTFRSFEKRTMKKYPARSVQDPNQLVKLGKAYGAVICGSDQVWNPDITGSDLAYFLNFCGESTKRISYAPSFGVESLTEEFQQAMGQELEQFSAISVREAQGNDLIRPVLGTEVPVVCDPTFLLSAEEWQTMERPHPAAKGEYILYYTIRSSHSLMKKCRELSKKTGLKIVVVGGNFVKRMRNSDPMVDYAVDVSPEEWLYLVRNARYVVTNSFHGTAFSVNFRKDFYVEFSSLTNSRLAQITKALGLEDRIVGDTELIPSAADYSVAEDVLRDLCKESWEYLSSALQEDEIHG